MPLARQQAGGLLLVHLTKNVWRRFSRKRLLVASGGAVGVIIGGTIAVSALLKAIDVCSRHSKGWTV